MNAPSHEPDLLHGIKPIAEFLGLTPRQAKHWHETNKAPFFKIGDAICARRSTLNAWLADIERRANPAPAASGSTS